MRLPLLVLGEVLLGLVLLLLLVVLLRVLLLLLCCCCCCCCCLLAHVAEVQRSAASKMCGLWTAVPAHGVTYDQVRLVKSWIISVE